jgi:hypothetical protein
VKLGLVDDDHKDDAECDHHEPHETRLGVPGKRSTKAFAAIRPQVERCRCRWGNLDSPAAIHVRQRKALKSALFVLVDANTSKIVPALSRICRGAGSIEFCVHAIVRD